jgi:hypothetical protein
MRKRFASDCWEMLVGNWNPGLFSRGENGSERLSDGGDIDAAEVERHGSFNDCMQFWRKGENRDKPSDNAHFNLL